MCFAKQANDIRGEAFWQCWREARDGVAPEYRLLRVVLDVHLKSARRALFETPPSVPASGANFHASVDMDITVGVGSAEDAAAPSVVAPLPLIPREWNWSRKLVGRFGENILSVIREWWVGSILPFCCDDVPLMWVSGFHLFMDFLGSMQHGGPVYHDRKWHPNFDDLPEGAAVPLLHRVRNFINVLRGFLADNCFPFEPQHTRCAGAAVAMRLASYRIRYPSDRVDWVDVRLFRVHGRQLTRLEHLQLISLDDFPVDWRVR